jgi:arylsulfatase
MATDNQRPTRLDRRTMLLGSSSVLAATGLIPGARAQGTSQGQGAQQSATGSGKPNILVIFGDDIGVTNVSAYSMGLMGYRTPNIDRTPRV